MYLTQEIDETALLESSLSFNVETKYFGHDVSTIALGRPYDPLIHQLL